jgi:hypothetical protein
MPVAPARKWLFAALTAIGVAMLVEGFAHLVLLASSARLGELATARQELVHEVPSP